MSWTLRRTRRGMSGPTLLGHLETVHIASDLESVTVSGCPCSGSIARTIRRIDRFTISAASAARSRRYGAGWPKSPRSAGRHRDAQLNKSGHYDGQLKEAFCPQSVTLVLGHDIDISRGNMIVGLDHLPGASSELQAEDLLDAFASAATREKIFPQTHDATRCKQSSPRS